MASSTESDNPERCQSDQWKSPRILKDQTSFNVMEIGSSGRAASPGSQEEQQIRNVDGSVEIKICRRATLQTPCAEQGKQIRHIDASTAISIANTEVRTEWT